MTASGGWPDGWKARARALKRDTYALYLACRDPRVPWYAKALAGAVVAYALSPLDLIPDCIPVVGYLDDLLLAPLGLALVLRLIPAPVMAECRREAAARLAAGSGRPRSWVGGPSSSRSGSCWRAWPAGSSSERPAWSLLGVSMEVPVQYFQSVIALETAVAGVLLFQTRFFETGGGAPARSGHDPRVRLLLLLVLVATVFGSLEAIREGGRRWAAVLVTVGLAVSLLPVVLRVLPPLRRDAQTQQRDPQVWVTVLGVVLYAAVVALVVSID
jgi:uncharacterized membrane protein YkvA (DUF1232 family)